MSKIRLCCFINSTLLFHNIDFALSRIRLCFFKNSTLLFQGFDFSVSRIRLCLFEDSSLLFQEFDFAFFKNLAFFLKNSTLVPVSTRSQRKNNESLEIKNFRPKTQRIQNGD